VIEAAPRARSARSALVDPIQEKADDNRTPISHTGWAASLRPLSAHPTVWGFAPMAQVRVLAVLAGKGIVAVGTPLEIVPAALPPHAASLDPRAFRASVADPMSPRRSLLWELDGQHYSPTELTCRLWREYGLAGLGPSYFSHWRIVGRERSLWDEAQALTKHTPES